MPEDEHAPFEEIEGKLFVWQRYSSELVSS
jgi:hypothetical protein